MELTNGRLNVSFSPNTGSLLRISDSETGIVHLDATSGDRTDGRLFRIIVPSESWSSRFADSHETSPPKVTEKEDGLSMLFTNLQAGGEEIGISAEVNLTLPRDADEIRFTIAIRNEGASPVTEVRFPWIGGWTGFGGSGADQMVVGASTEIDPHGFPRNRGMTYGQIHQRRDFCYPVEMYCPWVDLPGPGGGLSYINYMPVPRNGYFCVENLAGYGPGLRLAFGWVFPVVVKPGETWTSDPIAISTHSGDWRDTADRYLAWVRGWYKAAPSKRSARTSIGYQNVFFRGFDGTPFRGLDTIPEVAASGRKYGVNELVIWDFLTLGNYAKHADLDLLDYSAEERDILMRGLKEAKADGTNVSALVNFRLCNPASSLYRNEGHKEILMSYDGSPTPYSFCGSHNHGRFWTRHLGPLCYALSPFAPTYRERVLRQTKEYLDLGYTSMFYDQPFELNPDYGRMDQGCRPENTYGAVVDLVSQVRKLLHQADPDALMIGEQCDIFASQWIDLWMAWYTDSGPAMRAAYSIPQTMHSWVVDTDPGQASLAFAMGMYLCLCTHGNEATLDAEPEFAAHVATLARLRKRCADRTVHARFNHTRGLDVSGDESLVAFRYDGPQGPCVIAAAPKTEGTFTVEVDRSGLENPVQSRGCLHHLSGKSEEVSGDRCSITLGRNDVAVWEV